MKFKRTQDEIRWEIQSNANYAAKMALSQLTGGSYSGPMNSVTDAVAQAIAAAVAEGFRTMMANQYTDDDFERDIGLKT